MSETDIFILGIESSCDDTSVAITKERKVLANITANQKVHEGYGGVVPELASRAHLQNIVPVLDTALSEANVTLSNIQAIAYTRGPGLLGSLLVGGSFAKSLAIALEKPLIEVNHMQAHILAHMIEKPGGKPLQFPFICLTVSGGHTQIVLVEDHNNMNVLGSTIDDAAGEAFDKAAKILGLPYPGGPLIDKYASKGDIHAFDFPTPKVEGYNYSFSGLKTAFLYLVQEKQKNDPYFIKNYINDLCASMQHCIVRYLLKNLKACIKEHNVKDIAIAGGVSANSYLRRKVTELGEELGKGVYIPPLEYCTDNAAMIAINGYYKFCDKDFSDVCLPPKARYNF